MKLKVLFFGALAEKLQTDALDFEGDLNPPDLNALKQALVDQHPGWQALSTDQVLCAVNQTICQPDKRLSHGDEVAFFPPVTGG